MQMRLGEIKTRQNLLAPIVEKKLPPQLDHAIAKNLVRFQEETQIIESERIKLLNLYAKKDENNQPVIVNGSYELEDRRMNFENDFTEFLETEVDVEIRKVSCQELLEKLEDARYNALSPAEMLILDFMIEE